jgi:hypothetical protein
LAVSPQPKTMPMQSINAKARTLRIVAPFLYNGVVLAPAAKN